MEFNIEQKSTEFMSWSGVIQRLFSPHAPLPLRGLGSAHAVVNDKPEASGQSLRVGTEQIDKQLQGRHT